MGTERRGVWRLLSAHPHGPSAPPAHELSRRKNADETPALAKLLPRADCVSAGQPEVQQRTQRRFALFDLAADFAGGMRGSVDVDVGVAVLNFLHQVGDSLAFQRACQTRRGDCAGR